MNTENPMVAQYLCRTHLVDEVQDWTVFVWTRFRMCHENSGRVARGTAKDYSRLTTIGEVFHPDASVTSFLPADRSVTRDSIQREQLFDYPLYFALRDVLLNGAPTDV